MSGLEHHPYASRFPMLGDAELAEMVESIKASGLRNPIVLDGEGRILDGRNRERACRAAGVEPEFVTYGGDDLAEFVIDANSSRRHMSTGARAMSTALVLADDGRRENGRWKRGTIRDIGQSSDSGWEKALKHAGTVLDHAPHLAAEVIDGGVALDAAYRQAVSIRDAATREAEELARLATEEEEARVFVNAEAPDLAAQVGQVFETYTEALAIWQKRNRERAAQIAAERTERERRTREHAAGLRDLYSGIARAVDVIAGYGGYSNIADLWSEFDPEHLDPPQLSQVLTAERLADARRLIDWLDTWTKETT